MIQNVNRLNLCLFKYQYSSLSLQMAMDSSTAYGKRLIPQILDSLASAEPDRIIYSLATFPDISHEFRHISARTFAKAVDKTAWWLQNQIGRPISIHTVGYIGPRKLFKLNIVVLAHLLSTKMTFDTFC